jgi:hypothetical protein
MKIKFQIAGFDKPCFVIEPYLSIITKSMGLTPSEQLEAVRKNSHDVEYAILYDDKENVQEMFVKNLF